VFGDANLVILHMLYYPLGKVVLFVHIRYMENVALKEREGKKKWSLEFSLCAKGEGENEHSRWLQHSFYHHGTKEPCCMER